MLEHLVETARNRGDNYIAFYYRNTTNGPLWFTTYPKTIWSHHMDARYWHRERYFCLEVLDLHDPNDVMDFEHANYVLGV